MGGLLLILGLGPAVLSSLADAVAGWAGCTVTPALAEGPAAPCLIGGSDWGEGLHRVSILRWTLAFTLPVAAMGAAILVIRVGMDLWQRR